MSQELPQSLWRRRSSGKERPHSGIVWPSVRASIAFISPTRDPICARIAAKGGKMGRRGGDQLGGSKTCRNSEAPVEKQRGEGQETDTTAQA